MEELSSIWGFRLRFWRLCILMMDYLTLIFNICGSGDSGGVFTLLRWRLRLGLPFLHVPMLLLWNAEPQWCRCYPNFPPLPINRIFVKSETSLVPLLPSFPSFPSFANQQDFCETLNLIDTVVALLSLLCWWTRFCTLIVLKAFPNGHRKGQQTRNM